MTQPPFAWPGGKRALIRTLLTLIPEHKTYVEVFAGSGKLLFAKEPSYREVMNDLNCDVTNFFRVCKHRTAELTEAFDSECIHAGRFRELRQSQPTDELERALRFAYLTWYSFGAKGEHFAQSSAKERANHRHLTRVPALLAAVARRLACVLIETQDFSTILRRYDAHDTFFYLDPPYVEFQANGRYSALTLEERDELFRLLSTLRGKFLLSFDDHPEIRARAQAHDFLVKECEVLYTLGAHRSKAKRTPELLVANYDLTRAESRRYDQEGAQSAGPS